MGAIAELLDRYKSRNGLTSDNALANAIGVTRQTVSQWRAQNAYPDEDRIAEIAADANEDAAGWLGAVRAERTTGAAAAAYRKIARAFGVAAAIGLAVYTSILPNAIATPCPAGNNVQIAGYYVK